MEKFDVSWWMNSVTGVSGNGDGNENSTDRQSMYGKERGTHDGEGLWEHKV